MISTFPYIEKLSKENFDTWRMQMEAILIKNDHWSYVNGELKEPVDQEDIKVRKKVDQNAKADIVLATQPSELCIIKNCSTLNEVWVKLKQTYKSQGPARKQLLFTKMNEGDTMTDLNIVFNIIDQMV